MGFNRPFSEHIRLAFKVSFLIKHLQSGDQRKGAVLRKGGYIRPAVNQTILFGKGIVQFI